MAAKTKTFLVRPGCRVVGGNPARWYDAGDLVELTAAEARGYVKKGHVELYDAELHEDFPDENPKDSEPDPADE